MGVIVATAISLHARSTREGLPERPPRGNTSRTSKPLWFARAADHAAALSMIATGPSLDEPNLDFMRTRAEMARAEAATVTAKGLWMRAFEAPARSHR